VRRFALLFTLFLLPLTVSRAEQIPVDLELVLAVDASGSVDQQEFALQMQGLAAALRDPEVVAAIERGPLGRIAVALVIWAEHNRPKDSSAWALIQDSASAERFAATVAAFPRRVGNGATGIGKAIVYSGRLMQKNAYSAERWVVDVSGDGRETPADDFTVLLPAARAFAKAAGITVNGLAILNEDPALDDYYRRNVITGFAAFGETAADYESFAEAMRRKLIREIEGLPPLSAR